EAQALGANGVPFFVIDRKYGISGAQPPEAFTQALETAWGESQKLTVLAGGGSDSDTSTSGKGGDGAFREGAVCGPEGCD
ncbi:MAG: DsbA family protein, partial [Brevibacterium sp.]|nr:DsbA family protein [Brevibacterium sp.]